MLDSFLDISHEFYLGDVLFGFVLEGLFESFEVVESDFHVVDLVFGVVELVSEFVGLVVVGVAADVGEGVVGLPGLNAFFAVWLSEGLVVDVSPHFCLVLHLINLSFVLAISAN